MRTKGIIVAMLAVMGMYSFIIHDYHVRVNQLQTQLVGVQDTVELQKKVIAGLNDTLQARDKQVATLQSTLIQSATDGGWHMQDGIATAYSPYDNKSGIESDGSADTTSIGLQPGKGIIAVDPNKIPYNSEMLVIYPDGHIYKGVAGDTGGALRLSRGLHIDIYKDTYAETKQHGHQNVIILWKPKSTSR